MKILNMFLPLIALVALSGCSSFDKPPRTTTQSVNLKKYLGKWYEIASFPNYFQRGCRCTSAQYKWLGDNKISVLNRCIKGSNKKYSQAKATAWPVNASNSKLKVQFFWPFKGDYWILYLQKDYQYALVGSPNYKYLWILSRTKTLKKSVISKLISIAKEKGFDEKKLNFTKQNCKK